MQEKKEGALLAFSKQSAIFDAYNESNCITRYCRQVVYETADKLLKPSSSILEINCGTGIDAVRFAEKNHTVLATDGSEGMIKALIQKLKGQGNAISVKPMLLDYTRISTLEPQQFDFIFSNFGGLNCTEHLCDVLNQLPALLKPGGKLLMVIMPDFCWWETAFLTKLNLKLACRRWKKGGTAANVEGRRFLTYYYAPSAIRKMLAQSMKCIYLSGLCVAVPPEFMAHHMVKHPLTFKYLKKIDRKIAVHFPFNRVGDYFIIAFEKKSGL